MRKVITAVAAGASALVLAGTGVAWASGVAHADDTSMLITSACLTLNQYHSVAGVVGVVDYLEHDMGMTQYESGQMLAKIVAQCPSNRGVVEAFLDLDKEGMLPR